MSDEALDMELEVEASGQDAALPQLPVPDVAKFGDLVVRHVVTSEVIRLPNGYLTYGVRKLHDIGCSKAVQFADILTRFSGKPYIVIAELFDHRYGIQSEKDFHLVGYSLLSRGGDIVNISVSNLDDYADNIGNITFDSPNSVMGLSLDIANPVNKIYLAFNRSSALDKPAEFEDGTSGYHMQDGGIRVLSRRLVTSTYLHMCCNKDLTRIVSYLAKQYLSGSLSDIKVTFSYPAYSRTILTTRGQLTPIFDTNIQPNCGIAGHLIFNPQMTVTPSSHVLNNTGEYFLKYTLVALLRLMSGNRWNSEFVNRWLGILDSMYDIHLDAELATNLDDSLEFTCNNCGGVYRPFGNTQLRCPKCGSTIDYT